MRSKNNNILFWSFVRILSRPQQKAHTDCIGFFYADLSANQNGPVFVYKY